MRRKGRVLLAVLSALCILGGCGSNTGTESTEPSETQKINIDSSENVEQAAKNYVQPEMKGEITISCLFEEEFLTAAAEQFMDKYPDVTITINVSDGTVENYQTSLNTKLMGGKAEDIIFTSFLPVTKYSEMGAFEDLSSYISQTAEFTDENYYMNVLQAASNENGQIYMIPYIARFYAIGFSENLLADQPELESKLKSWEKAGFSESMNLAEQLVVNTEKENAFMIQMNETSYMDELLKDDFNKYIDLDAKTVDVDNSDYIGLLKSVKQLSEDGILGGSTDIDFYNTEYYFAATSDYDVQAAYYSLDKQSETAYCVPLANAAGNVEINANMCIALNSSSAHKDLAWEFMKYLLSDEVQTLPSIHGLAVNRSGFDASVERYYEYYADGDNGNVDEAEYREVLDSWMEQISSCDRVDATIWDLIDAENEKYFSGEQTAEVTAKNLQKQINQYFNE
jgi:multiple sugar transport system substrate-binding protein